MIAHSNTENDKQSDIDIDDIVLEVLSSNLEHKDIETEDLESNIRDLVLSKVVHAMNQLELSSINSGIAQETPGRCTSNSDCNPSAPHCSEFGYCQVIQNVAAVLSVDHGE